MDKISRILPASPRVTSTDTNESHPMRPGAPDFGNPKGISSSITDRVTRSSIGPSALAHHELNDGRSQDMKNAEIAQSLSTSFFGKRPLEKETEARDSDDFTIADQVASHALEQYKSEPLKSLGYSEHSPRSTEIESAGEDDVPLYMAPSRYQKGTNLSIKA